MFVDRLGVPCHSTQTKAEIIPCFTAVKHT